MTDKEGIQERQEQATDTVDVEATVIKILGKQQPDEAVGMLLKDNYKQRDRMRRQTDEITSLKSQVSELESQDPVDNTAELAKLAQWQELGEIDNVKGSLEKLNEMEYDSGLREVAEAAEMNFDVLKGLDRLNPDVVLSVQDGKPVVENGDKVTDLGDYAEANWASYMPSLKESKGTPYIQQVSSGTGSKGTDLVGSFLQGQKEKKEQKPSRLKMD